MAFSIRRLFSNLFLSVLIENNECIFYGRVFKKGKCVKTLNAKFTEVDPNNIDEKVITYIKNQEDSYYAVYLSIFFNFGTQGAVPTLKLENFDDYNISPEGLLNIKMQDKFSIYAKADDIIKAKNIFKDDYVDLIYSPIALLYSQLLKQGISDETTLYLYHHHDSCTLSIFSKGELQFATFFKIANITCTNDVEFTEEDISDIDNLIIQDEVQANSLDEFKSLEDMLDMDADSINSLDDESDSDEFEDLGYDINMPESNDVDMSVTIFGRDMNLYKYIQTAIKEYYNNPIYNADFVENIVIYDNEKISATFLQYLQAELFVETEVIQIETLHIMNDLMCEEIEL
ncbi:MAG: hypothetical protein K5978_08320 [Campylobacter sp.]|nr:hypothetical protein [Campylobacter sp.]